MHKVIRYIIKRINLIYLHLIINGIKYLVNKNFLISNLSKKKLIKLNVHNTFIRDPSLLFYTEYKYKKVSFSPSLGSLPNNEKIVVYSAITGDYDTIKSPLIKSKNCDYILFVDNNNIKFHDFWSIRQIPNLKLDPVRTARMIKILPHRFLPEYRISIWIDASFEVIGDLTKLLSLSDNTNFASFKHSQRNCLFEEAQICINMNKDKNDLINKQIQKYKHENMPENFGLLETGVLVRNHLDHKVMDCMEQWWQEVKNLSRRDQISLMYVIWKNNLKYNCFNGHIWNNQIMIYSSHSIDLYE